MQGIFRPDGSFEQDPFDYDASRSISAAQAAINLAAQASETDRQPAPEHPGSEPVLEFPNAPTSSLPVFPKAPKGSNPFGDPVDDPVPQEPAAEGLSGKEGSPSMHTDSFVHPEPSTPSTNPFASSQWVEPTPPPALPPAPPPAESTVSQAIPMSPGLLDFPSSSCALTHAYTSSHLNRIRTSQHPAARSVRRTAWCVLQLSPGHSQIMLVDDSYPTGSSPSDWGVAPRHSDPNLGNSASLVDEWSSENVPSPKPIGSLSNVGAGPEAPKPPPGASRVSDPIGGHSRQSSQSSQSSQPPSSDDKQKLQVWC